MEAYKTDTQHERTDTHARRRYKHSMKEDTLHRGTDTHRRHERNMKEDTQHKGTNTQIDDMDTTWRKIHTELMYRHTCRRYEHKMKEDARHKGTDTRVADTNTTWRKIHTALTVQTHVSQIWTQNEGRYTAQGYRVQYLTIHIISKNTQNFSK